MFSVRVFLLSAFVFVTGSAFAQPVPDFSLRDVNPASPRVNKMVSPRDYVLQVSGYYFGAAHWSYCRAQFGHLETIWTELKATNPAVNIEILGVNMNTDSFYNPLATAGRTLPWLQDTVANSAWTAWGVTWRDVRILDSRNELFAVYNLTSHDLAYATNRATLKGLLLEAARFVDTDGDQLDDHWELLNFGNLSASPLGDADSDGQDNFTEYAFGTSPTDPGSTVKFHTAIAGSPTNRVLALTFQRRAGSCVNYAIDASFWVEPWNSSSSNLVLDDPFRNLFDGRGIGQTRCTIPAPLGGSARRFIRVRATPQ